MAFIFNPNKKRGVFMIPSGATKSPTPTPPSFNNTYSLAFDGIDDYIETTKTTALTTASLSMWVKVSGNFGVNERQSLASNDDFNHGRDFVIADTPFSTNDAYIAMFAGGIIYGKTSALGGIPINDGNWHHLVWTYDSSAGTSASINMYVDGQNQYSNATYSSYWSYEIKFQYFGKPTSANTYFSGSMDEVAYFNSILSASDITSIYNSGVPNDLTSLNPIVWLRNGDNGTWKSPQWLIPNNENKTKFSNYSFDYDGVDDFIDTGAIDLGETNTISFWFKNNSANTGNGVIGDADNHVIYFQAVSVFYYPVGSTTGRKAFGGTNIANAMADTTNWHNIIFIRKAPTNGTNGYNDLACYLDGNLEGTFADIYTANINLIPVYIGKSGLVSSNTYDGLIDEVSYYDNDQTANVTSIYNSGVPTDISSLSPVGYWRSENSTFLTNWTVTDNGSGSNDGTSANMTIEDRVGDASNSISNAVSFNMDEVDRESDTPS